MTDKANGRGFIAIARGILDHPIVGARKPYTELDAWLWLLFEAAWSPQRIAVRNRNGHHTTIAIERGQLSHSLRYMVEAWGWRTDFRVRTFLKRLKINAQINTQVEAGQTVITICNYERYQNPEVRKEEQKHAQANAQYTRNTRKEEQGNKETKERAASPLWTSDETNGSETAEPVNEPPKAKLFRVGLTILVSMSVKEDRGRAVIGRWLKTNPDPIGILAALQYAADNGVIEPIGYVTALLAQGGKYGKAQISSSDRAKQLAEQARALERQADFGRSDGSF